jgi:type II secretory ATPase GspE/PulE/Tfp pilus assembly ATPase PilB-like protein
VTRVIERVLEAARAGGASDVHFVPGGEELQMLWRLDGVLQPVQSFPRNMAPNLVARLKVLADLLTYRVDVPQEGRIREGDGEAEMRVSTFPTLFGEKAVVRLFVGSGRYRTLGDLGFPDDVDARLRRHLLGRGGALFVTGPAGSGKTTTVYACLRELVDHFSSEKSLVTLEDPVEAVLPGVAQSQIRPAAGFDYETGLKSLMRQDPDVIMVGEVRDRTTAETVYQASMTGQLVLTTFHAGSAGEAISRLADMGIEPYLLRSGTLAVLSQRLVRMLCTCKREASPSAEGTTATPPGDNAGGCEDCRGTGYRGRTVLTEFLDPELHRQAHASFGRADAREIERRAVADGMATRWDAAERAVALGNTSAEEIRRVLGFAPQRGTAPERRNGAGGLDVAPREESR